MTFSILNICFKQNLGLFLGCSLLGVLTGCAGTEKLDYSSMTPCHANFAKRAYNKPYEIKGEVHVPQTYYEYKETGLASYYGGRDIFHGRPTSNGEIFNKNHITAAHKTLPIPCVVRVINLDNNRSLLVKVNDRGPFIDGRVIDVSEKVAKILGFHHRGLARVRLETDVPSSLRLANAMAASQKLKKRPRSKPQPLVPLMVAAGNTGLGVNKAKLSKEAIKGKLFFIDAGGFYQSAKAQLFASRLRARGAVVQVKNIKGPTTSFFRVLLGPYDSIQAAYGAIKKLRGPDLQAAKVIQSSGPVVV